MAIEEAKALAEMAGSKMMDSKMGGMKEIMAHSQMTGAVARAVAAATGKGMLKKITHPLVLIICGFALGYLAHKYRHEIAPIRHEDE